MKDILIATPKEEQFYEVIEFYRKKKEEYNINNTGKENVFHYESNNDLSYEVTQWFKENMPTHEILTFEQWKELVSEPEKVPNELIQDNDLDIQLLELARKLAIAGRIQDASTLSIIAGNSMKEKSK